MPRIRYTEGPDELNVEPKDGSPFFTATRGEWVEVPDAVGKSLAAQGWETDTKAHSAKKVS